MKIIGITGNSGSGKSLASSELTNYNCYVIDLDKIGHEIYSDKECFKEVTEKIQGDYLTDGKVDRKKLGNIVFSQIDKLKILTEITDKYIYKNTKKIVDSLKAEKKVEFIVIDGALILDSKTRELCTEIILICAKTETRIRRIIERDKLSYEEAYRRVNSQKDYRKNKSSNICIIDNDNDLEEFILNFKRVIERIRETL